MKIKTSLKLMDVVLIAILSIPLFANFALAETKTFIREYTYQAGDEDSKNSCRVIALREVKRLISSNFKMSIYSSVSSVIMRIKQSMDGDRKLLQRITAVEKLLT